MPCETDGHDPQYVSALNPFGWCPSPAPTGCFMYNLPWGGVQAAKLEGQQELIDETAKQAALVNKDYTRLFLLLDKYSCVSTFSVWVPADSGGMSLEPWKPPDTPTLDQYDANPGAYPPPIPSTPTTGSKPLPPPVAIDPLPGVTRPAGKIITEVQAPAPTSAAQPTTKANTGQIVLALALVAGVFLFARAV